MELVEHVPVPASVINACSRLVRPGGELFFSTINRTPKAWLFAIVGAEYLLNILPKGTHTYEKFIRPSELEKWARESGLVSKEITGMHYNPFTDHYWLAPGVEVNYLLHSTHQG
jgi:2-polyprenyl-6-hydroxyphenyl methylase/3-demethylubiquinone-9 3-methyltransferase